MNSKLVGTTMSKISFEGVVALKRAGLVSTFRTVHSFRTEQSSGEATLLTTSQELSITIQPANRGQYLIG